MHEAKYAQKSKPLRLRGLKFLNNCYGKLATNVEAFAASWIEILTMAKEYRRNLVEAFAASWIEITMQLRLQLRLFVEAFAASWIEIIAQGSFVTSYASKPLRLRGLKFLELIPDTNTMLVEAFAASWIEIPAAFLLSFIPLVEAFAASWIEIYYVLMVI